MQPRAPLPLTGALATALSLGLFTASARAADITADWPGWRGPERTGISRETGWSWDWSTNGPPVLWRASVGTGFSSFAAVGSYLYTMGNDGQSDTVFCLRQDRGDLVWRHSYPCDPQPLSYEGGPSSTPLVHGDRVYAFSKSGDLFCLDAATGRPVWSRKFEPWPQLPGDWVNRWRYASSPLLLNGKLFLGIGQAGIAMDPHNGQVQWESPAGHPGYSSPVPYRHAGQDTLVFFSGHAVTAVEPASGRRRWSVPWNTLWDLNAADPILHEQRLFVSSGNGVGCALYDLAPPQPRELWRNRNLKTTLNASVLWNGFLYGFNDTHLACISWETGEEQWSTRDVRNGSLIVAGGTLVLLSETGKLVVAHPTEKAYEPLAAAQVLSGRCWTTPVLSRGRLFVRNAAGEVVALDLRPAAR